MMPMHDKLNKKRNGLVANLSILSSHIRI